MDHFDINIDKIDQQAELGVPHSKSKLSGPNEKYGVLRYFGLNKKVWSKMKLFFRTFHWPKKLDLVLSNPKKFGLKKFGSKSILGSKSFPGPKNF